MILKAKPVRLEQAGAKKPCSCQKRLATLEAQMVEVMQAIKALERRA